MWIKKFEGLNEKSLAHHNVETVNFIKCTYIIFCHIFAGKGNMIKIVRTKTNP